MYTDLESILALSMEVREKESEARVSCMGNRRGLYPWNRSCDWDGSDDGVGRWQRCRIMGLDRCCESLYQLANFLWFIMLRGLKHRLADRRYSRYMLLVMSS